MTKRNNSKASELNFKAFLKGNRGNAAIMVISVILILTMFGTVSLFASLANIKMGNRLRTWTTNYYSADKLAEEKVKQVDEILKKAEALSNRYMQNKCYESETLSDEVLTGAVSSDAQKLFYDNSFEKKYAATYADYLNIHPDESESDYQNLIKLHNKEYYEKLYFYFVNEQLTDPDNEIDGVSFAPVSAFQVTAATSWDSLSYADTRNLWKVTVKANGADASAARCVTATLKIVPPNSESAIKYINNPVKANPLWGYALAADGKITFDNDSAAEIYGDVFSAGRADDAPTDVSISVQDNSNVKIYGNVYANGDLAAEQCAGAELTVYTHGTDYSNKEKIYSADSKGRSLYLDTSNTNLYGSDSANYTEDSGSIGADIIPLLYQDNKGGNVYCHDLKVQEDAAGAHIEVKGNLITSDDIEMNGDSSSITVDGNYVGINSEADLDTKNPNASSSVINNKPLYSDGTENSSIYLKGGVIVPGIAFGEYDSGPGGGDMSNYYPTAESVSARLDETFQAYLYPEGTDVKALADAGISPDPAIYNKDGVDYYLKSFIEGPDKHQKRIYNFIESVSGDLKTRIFITSLNGYSLGVVIPNQNPDGPIKPTTIDGYTANQNAYNTAKTLLKNVFDAKTLHFGFGGYEDMENLVDPAYTGELNALKEYKVCCVSGTLDLGNTDSITHGIIYSPGNLNITGNGGSFEGVIICKGDVNISGNVTLNYNESVINDIFENPGNVTDRKFFERGGIGATYTHYTDYTTDSGTKEIKRFSIESWIEDAKD